MVVHPWDVLHGLPCPGWLPKWPSSSFLAMVLDTDFWDIPRVEEIRCWLYPTSLKMHIFTRFQGWFLVFDLFWLSDCDWMGFIEALSEERQFYSSLHAWTITNKTGHAESADNGEQYNDQYLQPTINQSMVWEMFLSCLARWLDQTGSRCWVLWPISFSNLDQLFQNLQGMVLSTCTLDTG